MSAETPQDTVDRLTEQLRIAIEERAHEDEIVNLRNELTDAKREIVR